MKKYEEIHNCRVCGSKNLLTCLDLGVHPLANSLKIKQGEMEEKLPLTLLFCPDCSLVQLKETVNKEILFKDYVWVTGTSATSRNYAKKNFKEWLI